MGVINRWGFCKRVGCQRISRCYNSTHGYICTECKVELSHIITDVLSIYPDADIDIIIATYMRTPKENPHLRSLND